jgi:diguanylate cyclase (GGDEF)-like protein/PAS domain S-box-containing protein
MLEYVESIMNTAREPLVVLDQDLRVVTVSSAFYKLFRGKPANTIGYLIYELCNKQFDIALLRELLETILPQKTSFNDYLIEQDFAIIGPRTMLLNARKIVKINSREHIVLLAIEDVSERADELGTEKQEKYKRESELVIAKEAKSKLENELDIANEEKDKQVDELDIANEEKDKQADELDIANKEKDRLVDKLDFANEEKSMRAGELGIAKEEKVKRADELIIANKELAFQNKEKDKRADELVIANNEKDKRADELIIANYELTFQNEEKDKRAFELSIANEEKEGLLRKLKRAASVFSHADEGIMITDATATITEINTTFSRITGYTSEEVLGKNANILQSGHHSLKFYAEMWSTLQTQGSWRGELWNRRKNGETFPVMLTISAVKNGSGLVQHFVSVCTDITTMKRYQQQLEDIAHYDVLTKLPNRVLLADRLSQAMLKCQRCHQSLVVAFMDLDGFKEINDQHGHNVGDELLITVSNRMKNSLREGDTLARIGGDEFIAIIGDLEIFQDSKPVLNRLLKAAANPVRIGNKLIKVSASIGVTFYPEDNSDAEQLMRHADQAMYVAKREGKNSVRVFDTVQDSASKTQLESIDDIRLALQRREFVLYYQPKVNMLTGEVIGVESLIRWQHPELGLVPPLEFLPVIEEQAISLELGEWVITSALSQISHWQNIGVKLAISVNVSGYQLQQANFVERLAALLAAHPEVQPYCLELEILETGVLHDVIKVSATMKACHELGVSFALDDFGTGYSSLTHLRHLPAQLIKIDQSFVRDMLEDVDDCAIVEGVIGLAKAFRRGVIAEGVETIAHGIALLQLGCELAQGYGIARPMPESDIPQWLSQWKADESWLMEDPVTDVV